MNLNCIFIPFKHIIVSISSQNELFISATSFMCDSVQGSKWESIIFVLTLDNTLWEWKNSPPFIALIQYLQRQKKGLYLWIVSDTVCCKYDAILCFKILKLIFLAIIFYFLTRHVLKHKSCFVFSYVICLILWNDSFNWRSTNLYRIINKFWIL